MRDYLEIGCVPCDEDCQQVGTPSYNPAKARVECRAFVHQLVRQFGNPPDGARLRIKSNPHEFGTYLDVVCYYDDENEASMEYAFKLESDSPTNWDDEARAEIANWERMDSMVS